MRLASTQGFEIRPSGREHQVLEAKDHKGCQDIQEEGGTQNPLLSLFFWTKSH